MDPEFPKTLNSAVSIAGKVHGSLADLSKSLAQLDTHLGELTTHMNYALAAMKALPDLPPVPVAAADTHPVSEATDGQVNKAHVATSTPEK